VFCCRAQRFNQDCHQRSENQNGGALFQTTTNLKCKNPTKSITYRQNIGNISKDMFQRYFQEYFFNSTIRFPAVLVTLAEICDFSPQNKGVEFFPNFTCFPFVS
jgi:hypothetical protein